jgi:hypothetical protein
MIKNVHAWSGAAEAPRGRRPATPHRCRVSLCSVRMAIARGDGQKGKHETGYRGQHTAWGRQAPRGLPGAVAHVPFSRLPGNLDLCFASLCKTLLCSARRVVAADVCVKCRAAPLKWRESARSKKSLAYVCVVWFGWVHSGRPQPPAHPPRRRCGALASRSRPARRPCPQ